MKWLIDFLFKSSIGRKVVMSLTGLFLILFLVVHLLGNLQLLNDDGGKAFNTYTYFMTHNPIIIFISYFLYLCIILHTIQGIILSIHNRKAKGKNYAIQTHRGNRFFSKYMIHLGVIILIFILIHMYQFWLQMKLGNVEWVSYPGSDQLYKDLYTPVMEVFQNIGFVIFYILSMIILSFHLLHGFESAFQSIGMHHIKYNSLIRWIGILYSILIPFGFSILPVYIYFIQS